MALVVLLRGVNVGGHRTLRPSEIARRLHQFDVVNVGAAGTFVVRHAVAQTNLRAAFDRLLPFDAHLVICRGSDVVRLAESNPLAGQPAGPHIIRFVSVLPTARRPSSPLPQCFPPAGRWGLRIVGQQGQFVFGVYRREMKAIGYLNQLDRLYGVRATTRNWNTILAVARLVEAS